MPYGIYRFHLGMGYGTALTPILLMMGFEPMQVVPAVLLAELFTGFAAGIMHAKVGNVDFRVKTLNPKKIVNSIKENGFFATIQKGMSQHLKIALLIGLFSALGAVTGSAVAINLPSFYLKLYIGVLVVTIGIYILVTYNKQFTFTWSKLTVLSIIASFNKGISGGGYGRLSGGQILSGWTVKRGYRYVRIGSIDLFGRCFRLFISAHSSIGNWCPCSL